MTIENDWRKLSIGIHIHRYYLHVLPYMRKKYNFKNDDWDIISNCTDVNMVKNLYFKDKKWYTLDIIDKEKIISSLTLLGDYIFLVNLSHSSIREINSNISCDEFSLKIDSYSTVEDMAIDILKQSSSKYIELYILSLEENFKNMDKDKLYVYLEILKEYFSQCIIYNFLIDYKIKKNPMLRSLGTYILENQSNIKEIIDDIDYQNVYDIINAFTPNSKRYVKYWNGMGIGQS